MTITSKLIWHHTFLAVQGPIRERLLNLWKNLQTSSKVWYILFAKHFEYIFKNVCRNIASGWGSSLYALH
jgi:hypothetical protein